MATGRKSRPGKAPAEDRAGSRNWQWFRRGLLTTLVLASLWLGWTLLYGEKGWLHRQAVLRQIEQVEAENDQLHRQILRQQRDLEILKTNEAALEEQARVRLGMVSPGETLFIPAPEEVPQSEDGEP